ncbi:MAG: hypothetical protein ACREPW_07570 [Candidatus Binataceae bacterium]
MGMTRGMSKVARGDDDENRDGKGLRANEADLCVGDLVVGCHIDGRRTGAGEL